MRLKDYQKLTELVKLHLREYMEENKFIINGSKCQCPNGSAHINKDAGKLSASFLPGAEKTKLYCFVENKCYDIFDVYSFVTGNSIRGAAFFQTLKFFCEKYSIPYEEVYGHSPKDIEKSKKQLCLEKLHALSFCKERLEDAKEFYLRRKLSPEKIKFFKIGFLKPEIIPDELDEEFTKLFEYSIKKTLVGKALAIPVLDGYNQYHAMILRQFDVKDEFKYLNYSIAGKGLFNENNAKREDMLYVVEGVFDAMALYPETNVIGVLTNGVKADDLEFFKKRKFKTINIALDEDNSRRKKEADGIFSTIMALKNVDAELNVIKLPYDTDPDEIVANEGLEKFYSLEKISAMQYLLSRYKEGAIDKSKIYEFIAGCPDVINRENYVNLVSKELDIGKRALTKEIDKIADSDATINLMEYAHEKADTEELLDSFTEEAMSCTKNVVSSGFELFDTKVGGFEDTIYMMIAHPEQGKSLMLLSYMKNILLNPNNFVAFYSLDDGVQRAILPRLLAMITGLSTKQIKKPTPDIKDKWEEGIAKLRMIKDNFILKDGSAVRNVSDLENLMKIHKSMADERGKKFICIIDNIHCLVSAAKFESTENMQRVAAFLKKVPQIYNCPVICTAEVPKSASAIPTGKDIKESIDLWYAARCVIGLRSPQTDTGDTNLMWDSGNETMDPIIQMYVSKNQTGDTWHGNLYYKVRKADNLAIECTEDECITLNQGGTVF